MPLAGMRSVDAPVERPDNDRILFAFDDDSRVTSAGCDNLSHPARG
jgi:hypothetical protein